MKRVLVVILNWNSINDTRRCINSLVSKSGRYCDILVVDNNSNIDPTEILNREFNDIRIVRNSSNLGVAGGRNIGIKVGLLHKYQFILLFDNDAVADERMVTELLESARNNPESGIFGPKILSLESPNIIQTAGCTSWQWTYLHAGYEIMRRICSMVKIDTPKLIDTGRGANQNDEGQFDTERNVSFQLGCAQLIRTEVIRKIGLLDEELSPYGSEDIDFCVRSTSAGWKIRYVPKARCWHKSESSFRDEYKRPFYNTRNLLLLARKNLSPAYFWLLFLPDFFLLTVPLMVLETIVKKTPVRRKAVLEAIRWNVRDSFSRGVLLNQA